jgi:cell surface protein SprA
LLIPRRLLVVCALLAPGLLGAQTLPRDTARTSDTTRQIVLPRPPADTDTTRRTNLLGIPGTDALPIQFNLRTESKTERDRNLSCNTVENAQVNALTGCRGGFITGFDSKAAIKANGTIGRVNVNIDYDMQREFDASNSFSLSYQGDKGDKLQRVDVGNITFTAPSSRFITPTLPSGNYGIQAVNQFGRLQVRSIFARQTGNIVQDRHFTMGARTEQPSDREIEDRQIEPRRFFFLVDPALFGQA